MKKNKLYILALLMLTFSYSTFAKTIRVSTKSGNSYNKLKSAIAQAASGDVVLVDINVFYGANDGVITMTKNGVTLKGVSLSKGKYKIQRPNNERVSIKVIASDVTVQNLSFVGATQQLLFSNPTILFKNSKVINCLFTNAGYTGLDFRGKFQNTLITNCKFYDCPFSLQTFDCPVLNGFKVEKCRFVRGDHQLSLDNPYANVTNHSNILIYDNTFGVTKRFNIALANTRNVRIEKCTMNGGTGNYSQALHIEDRTKNVYVVNNTIKNLKDVALLSYSTDKYGHGTGDPLDEDTKISYGSENITLDNNVIESGSNDAAISIGYGKGYFKIYGNNVIKSGNRGISTFKSASTVNFQINNNVSIKGKKYSEIKNISNTMTRESYVRIR